MKTWATVSAATFGSRFVTKKLAGGQSKFPPAAVMSWRTISSNGTPWRNESRRNSV